MKRLLALALAFWAALSLSFLLAQEPQSPESSPKLAPYYPTPPPIVERMLTVGELKPGELHYDLGSGDGRVVIMAAQKFGARSVGFEIDDKLVAQSRGEITRLGLENVASILQQDLMTADFSKPDLITVYLLPGSNRKLLPLLEKQVKPGARIVSHDFAFQEWKPEKTVSLDMDIELFGLMHTVYLYRR